MNYTEILNWDDEVRSKFNDLNVCVALVKNIDNSEDNTFPSEERENILRQLRETYTLTELKNNPIIRAYRDFYWSLKIDPTKIRPAGEALVRRVLSGKPFPKISAAVDSYNLASVESFIALSGYDFSKITFPLKIRFSNVTDTFLGIGKNKEETLGGSKLVLLDKNNVICVYPYRDSEYTKIDFDTKDVLLVGYGVPKLDTDKIFRAVQLAYKNIHLACGGDLEFIRII
ncbi:MAG: B3/B4 domain-containing protein [Candidatus Odinarchaeia archaeon]